MVTGFDAAGDSFNKAPLRASFGWWLLPLFSAGHGAEGGEVCGARLLQLPRPLGFFPLLFPHDNREPPMLFSRELLRWEIAVAEDMSGSPANKCVARSLLLLCNSSEPVYLHLVGRGGQRMKKGGVGGSRRQLLCGGGPSGCSASRALREQLEHAPPVAFRSPLLGMQPLIFLKRWRVWMQCYGQLSMMPRI